MNSNSSSFRERKRLPGRRPTWCLVLALGAALGGIAWVARSAYHQVESARGDPKVVPYEHVDDWQSEIASGKDPVFVRAERKTVSPESGSAGASKESLVELARGESLGLLQGTDLSQLLSTCSTQINIFQTALTALQDRADPSDAADLAEQGRLAYLVEVAAAAHQAVLTGHYSVVTQKTANMIFSPPNCAKQTMPCVKDGANAIAVVLATYERYPLLQAARNYQEDTRRLYLQDVVRRFNARTFSDRMKNIATYDELQARKAAGERVASDEHSFLLRQFPSGLVIDRESALLRVQ